LLSISIPLLQDAGASTEAGASTTTPRTAAGADLLTSTTIASTTTFYYSTTTTYLSSDLQRFYCSYLKNSSFIGYFNLEHVCTTVTKLFNDKENAAHFLNLSSIIQAHN